MRPLALALGEFHEVGDGLRRIFLKQPANDGSFRGFKRSVKSGLAGHEFPFEFVLGRWSLVVGGNCLLSPEAFVRSTMRGDQRTLSSVTSTPSACSKRASSSSLRRLVSAPSRSRARC